MASQGKSNLQFMLNNGSESAFDFHCDLCDMDDNYVEAVGYCDDCRDYLCQECYNHHLKPKPMRHHFLLDQHRMPKDKSRKQIKDKYTEPCAEHENETLKYYCSKHKQFGCGACKVLYHQNCEDVKYIPDIAGEVLESSEYKDFKMKVKNMKQYTQQAQNLTQSKSITSNQHDLDDSEIFTKLKRDFSNAVDKLNIKIMRDIGLENQKKLKLIEDQYKQHAIEIDQIDSKFIHLEDDGQLCQIFFSMKRSTDEVASLESCLKQLQDQSDITKYVIDISTEVQNFIQNPDKIASLKFIKVSRSESSHAGGLQYKQEPNYFANPTNNTAGSSAASQSEKSMSTFKQFPSSGVVEKMYKRNASDKTKSLAQPRPYTSAYPLKHRHGVYIPDNDSDLMRCKSETSLNTNKSMFN